MTSAAFNGLLTAALLAAFIGIALWAWSKRRKADFDAAARLPLEPVSSAPPTGNDGGSPPAGNDNGGKS